MSLPRRALLRHFVRHPWQGALAAIGVAVGVAVVVAIDSANGSALAAFARASDTLAGRATHQIVGGPTGVPEAFYRELRADHGVRRSAPVVEGLVRPGGGRSLRLLGVDPFAEAPFRTLTGAAVSGELELESFLIPPPSVLLGPGLAAELGLAAGDAFELEAAGRRHAVTVAGVLDPGAVADGAADLLIADLSTAQELLGAVGRLTRIDLAAPEGDLRQPFLDRVAALLPAGLRLETSASRTDTAEEMTRAFRTNLAALSLLALLCGAFLIYNTITFAVVQRRRLLGLLRAVGITRAEVARLLLGEALLIGAVGSVAGLLLGQALAGELVTLVTRTINDLYFTVSVRSVELSAASLVKGAALGLGASLVAAAAPAWEAMSATPRSSLARMELEGRVHRLVPRAAAAGCLLAAVGAGLLAIDSLDLAPAFAGLFAVLSGFALLTPLATLALVRLLTPVAGLLVGQLGRMAARGVAAALSRTGVAIAALVMAVSVTVGVDLMIRGFRSTVESWLAYTLPADLYLRPEGTTGDRFTGRAAAFSADDVAALAALPEVEAVDTVRVAETADGRGGARLVVHDLSPRGRGAYRLSRGEAESAWPRWLAGEVVFVSEPYAVRREVGPGDVVELDAPDGGRRFEIAGVFDDYSSERGSVLLAGPAYRSIWGDAGLDALSLHAAPGTDLRALAGTVEIALGRDRPLEVRTNRELRRVSLEVFDRTFVVTGVLRMLAVIVAFVGVLAALTALQLERRRELGVLRAIGLTPGEVWRVVTTQTGLMGLVAGVLAIPAGVTMAAIMIFVINRRAFGWSLTLELDPLALSAAVGLAVGAALVAGIYPAWRMARTPPAEALRSR